MQKILSVEEKDRKTKIRQFVVGILLISLMLFSTLGFAFSNANQDTTSNRVIYNGIEFSKDIDYWRFTSNGYEFLTRYNPQEILPLAQSQTSLLSDYTNEPLYFSGEDGEHFIELERNLRGRVLRISKACIDTTCEEDLPIKNCVTDSVIIYKNATNSEEEKIYQEEKCIFIVAQTKNQAHYADAVLFKMLGII